MNTDPIADYLTRIRNASRARHASTVIPYSKIKEGISKVLVARKFIKNYEVQTSGKFKELIVELKDWSNEPIQIKRISKPGQRIYLQSKEIKRVKSGLGMIVVSTPKGIMSGEEAYNTNVGGEILCEVY
ncbi:30S ribosomal protein S8 [Patescibacteria group bacterium]|nr:30S ribosomal protein S8 [Patescibacteria group bacterium]